MKFNFKIQQYQTDAVEAVIKVFNGQGFHDKICYVRDLGKMKASSGQMALELTEEEIELYDPANDTGYKNEIVQLSDEQILQNIQTLQGNNNIKLSSNLVKIWADVVLILKWKPALVKPMSILRRCLN